MVSDAPEVSHKVSRDKSCCATIFVHFIQSCPVRNLVNLTLVCWLKIARKNIALSLAHSNRERNDSLVVCGLMWTSADRSSHFFLFIFFIFLFFLQNIFQKAFRLKFAYAVVSGPSK